MNLTDLTPLASVTIGQECIIKSTRAWSASRKGPSNLQHTFRRCLVVGRRHEFTVLKPLETLAVVNPPSKGAEIELPVEELVHSDYLTHFCFALPK